LKNHTKVYLNHFGYTGEDFIPCETCGARAVDIHHIEARGMGGTKKADTIDNLMALCREHHLEYGDKKQYMEFLKDKHKEKLDGKD
jgi:hypothetical protein